MVSWTCSSIGRAPACHAGGSGIETHQVRQVIPVKCYGSTAVSKTASEGSTPSTGANLFFLIVIKFMCGYSSAGRANDR
jgi:hypothetical protein